MSDYINQQKNYSLSEQQSVSILRSTLSPDSVKAYIACLQANKGLTIQIPDAALKEDTFQFTVDWSPNYHPRKNLLELKVTNGKIEGDNKVVVDYPVSKTFTLTRDLGKTLFLSASIDSQSDIVSLPALPKFIVKLREKLNPPSDKPAFNYIEDGGHNLTPVRVDYCFSADPDSLLLPSTMLAQVQISGDPRRAYTTINEDKKNNGLNSCGRVYDSTGCKECTQQVTGRFSIWEAYITDAEAPVLSKADYQRARSVQDIK
jgi:hypothetical protein